MRKVILIVCFLSFSSLVFGQELNARVQILAPKIGNANKRNLDVLQNAIRDFLNNNKWTNETYQAQERIACNLVITLTAWDGNASYSAEAQIQSSRPVYGTSYSTTLLNFNDKDFNFNYSEGQALDFSEQNFVSNLSSLLSFYAYTIIGIDKDSFAKLGGNTYHQKAQNSLNIAQTAGAKGWKPADGYKNRYWLNENLLSPSMRNLRTFIYEYHLNGLDRLQANKVTGLKNIVSAINTLKQLDRQKPGSLFPNIYFSAKAEEMTRLLAMVNTQDRVKAYNILAEIDHANLSKYNSLKSN